MDLPAAWVAESSEATIELSSDGTGRVEDLPVWDGHGRCGVDRSRPYTGEVTWTSVGESALEIATPEGRVAVWADGHFMSFDWSTVEVAICGSDSQLEDLTIYTHAA